MVSSPVDVAEPKMLHRNHCFYLNLIDGGGERLIAGSAMQKNLVSLKIYEQTFNSVHVSMQICDG
jgi:hypothetical protein